MCVVTTMALLGTIAMLGSNVLSPWDTDSLGAVWAQFVTTKAGSFVWSMPSLVVCYGLTRNCEARSGAEAGAVHNVVAGMV
jgi:hypothetical protein